MADDPYFTSPANAQSMGVLESFSDYLMYKPNIQGSVWIALSELDWELSATVTAGQAGSTTPMSQPGAEHNAL